MEIWKPLGSLPWLAKPRHIACCHAIWLSTAKGKSRAGRPPSKTTQKNFAFCYVCEVSERSEVFSYGLLSAGPLTHLARGLCVTDILGVATPQGHFHSLALPARSKQDLEGIIQGPSQAFPSLNSLIKSSKKGSEVFPFFCDAG